MKHLQMVRYQSPYSAHVCFSQNGEEYSVKKEAKTSG